jgi:hypothetical protein
MRSVTHEVRTRTSRYRATSGHIHVPFEVRLLFWLEIDQFYRVRFGVKDSEVIFCSALRGICYSTSISESTSILV